MEKEHVRALNIKYKNVNDVDRLLIPVELKDDDYFNTNIKKLK